MENKILTKIIYWKDKSNKYEDNLYYVQFEYNNKYGELKLMTEEELLKIKNQYKDLIE
jgi:hypothetical protein